MSAIYCTICDKIVETTDYDLKESITTHSKTILIKLLESFIEDFPTTTTTNNLICNDCYLQLNQLDNLQIRVKSIQNEFRTFIENRRNHIKLEQPPEMIESGENDLLANVETIEPNPAETRKTKPYECNECPKTWQTMKELKAHQLTHNKDRPYVCEICGQSYKRKKALTIHVAMHNGINQFQCEYCNKSFTQKAGLMRHLPIHTGEMPYQCDICGKRFIHHTSFSIHRTSHTGEKTHKCNICGLLLMSTSHLKRHTRVHTGEKRFSCTQCGRKFAERYNLIVHEKTHSNINENKKFKCQICGKQYSRQAKLEQHLLYTHQKIYNESTITTTNNTELIGK